MPERANFRTSPLKLARLSTSSSATKEGELSRASPRASPRKHAPFGEDMTKETLVNAGRLRSVHGSNGADASSSGTVGDDRDDLLVKSESVKNLNLVGGRPPEGRGALAFLRSRETALGVLSMVLLVFQGTALSLVLRYSRTRPGVAYLPSVAVIYTELIKLVICIGAQGGVCLRTSGERGLTLREEISHQSREILGRSWPMVVPAGLFVMQQVLVIVAASHLDAVTFQICSQSFKIMPTAVFAVWLLGQYLTPMQWGSLPVLAFGVVFVTLNGSSGSDQQQATSDQVLLGLGASALSGLSSAYAGVYFEKYVKGKQGQTLWIRNLQLSIYGVPLAMLYCFLRDGSKISEGGLHQGFDLVVWCVVGLQIFGGLIVGMVVKYADNILKNFANALSVIFTVLGAMPLFGQYPSGWFIIGVALVSLSVFMYGKSAPQLFSAFDICGGCRKMTHSYDNDGGGCLPMVLGRQRGPDGRPQGRRAGLMGWVRITIAVTAALMLLILVVSLGHPSTQALVNRSMQHIGGVFRGQKVEQASIGLRGASNIMAKIPKFFL